MADIFAKQEGLCVIRVLLIKFVYTNINHEQKNLRDW
jgi:hypothetical protein